MPPGTSHNAPFCSVAGPPPLPPLRRLTRRPAADRHVPSSRGTRRAYLIYCPSPQPLLPAAPRGSFSSGSAARSSRHPRPKNRRALSSINQTIYQQTKTPTPQGGYAPARLLAQLAAGLRRRRCPFGTSDACLETRQALHVLRPHHTFFPTTRAARGGGVRGRSSPSRYALRAFRIPRPPLAFRLVGPVRLRLTSAACAGRPPPQKGQDLPGTALRRRAAAHMSRHSLGDGGKVSPPPGPPTSAREENLRSFGSPLPVRGTLLPLPRTSTTSPTAMPDDGRSTASSMRSAAIPLSLGMQEKHSPLRSAYNSASSLHFDRRRKEHETES